jgi:SepF-like predicted cell division protein (DUF552 family)
MKIPFFGKDDEEDMPADSLDSYAQLPEDVASDKINIMVDKLEGMSQVDKIMRKVREGNIVIASISKMREDSTEELKHCISRMKTATTNIQGDIAGAGEEWLIITPPSAAVHRDPVVKKEKAE